MQSAQVLNDFIEGFSVSLQCEQFIDKTGSFSLRIADYSKAEFGRHIIILLKIGEILFGLFGLRGYSMNLLFIPSTNIFPNLAQDYKGVIKLHWILLYNPSANSLIYWE